MQVSPPVGASNTTVDCGLTSPLVVNKSINYILYQTVNF